jgi:hypothetical protein
MPRWLYKIHRWVVGGEAWAAAYTWLSENLPKLGEWIKDHWASLLAMLGSWGLGTWFASGINAVNEWGWGAWPFVGAIFALIVSLAFWLFSLSLWWRTSRWEGDNHRTGENTYAISRITLFCNAALDPAADALLHISNEIHTQIERNNQTFARLVQEQRDLMSRLTTGPRDRIHDLLAKHRATRTQLSEYEAARILRSYLEGYVLTLQKLTDIVGQKEFIKKNGYPEWRFRHREFTRMRGDLSQERRLRAVTTILGCMGTIDDNAYPDVSPDQA